MRQAWRINLEFDQYLSMSAGKGQPIQCGSGEPSSTCGRRRPDSIWDGGAIHVEGDPKSGDRMFNRAKGFEHKWDLKFLFGSLADIAI